ncbi:hypothetical protein ACVWWI_006494 [Bradyrhizobium sp. USDA 3686]|uniref:hypothetical protein n=1 Tax=Bradyrhizobium canariense TaxID=255045 RepID=UPI00195929F5|nr:hypothetical protein [Bradyrhizobium canariense]MBM7487958.1 hypothetical protein [Bradyrhizobium canariense]
MQIDAAVAEAFLAALALAGLEASLQAIEQSTPTTLARFRDVERALHAQSAEQQCVAAHSRVMPTKNGFI